MINENFVILGAILSLIGAGSYLFDTIKGKVKPNRITWFLWALAPFLAFSAEIKQGVGLQSLLTFMVGFNPLLIFLASFINKKSYWNITTFDIICGTLSILGLLLWYITKLGDVGIFFAILADGLAGVPTIIKAYKNPETENVNSWVFFSANAAITLFTIKNWNLAHAGFPIYIFLFCSFLFLILKFRAKKLGSSI